MNTNERIGQDKFPYKMPKLSKPIDDDLTKQWSVDYGVWSFDKNKMVRKRYIVTGNTVKARLERAAAAIDELSMYLQDGRAFVGTKPESLLKQAPTDQ